jgi:hypothetical protein
MKEDKREIGNYFGINKNESSMYKNVWDTAKAEFKIGIYL